MSDLPIDSGTIAIAPVIGRTQVWMGANGGVAGTWVIYINDQNVLSIPQTQKVCTVPLSPQCCCVLTRETGLVGGAAPRAGPAHAHPRRVGPPRHR